MAFTEDDAASARWEGVDYMLSAGDCLFLNVRKNSKTWLIRRRLPDGRMRVRTIGHYPVLKVKPARLLALEAALSGEVSNMTVEQLAREFGEALVLEQKRPEQAQGYLARGIVPALGHRRVVEITPGDIANVIRQYRSRGPRAADSLRSVFRALFGFATEIGVRPDNPAATLTRRVSGYRPEARARVLSDDEIRLIWSVDHDHGRLLRFLLLTGLRIGEAQNGEQEADRWHVSPQLSKNGRSHWVHLTPTALAQLPLLATTPTAVQSWVSRWLMREGIHDRFVPHDLRRTAATRLATAGTEPFIIERVLNHTLQGVMGTYNRAEYAPERIAAALTLERVLMEIVNNE
jgi:integrase